MKIELKKTMILLRRPTKKLKAILQQTRNSLKPKPKDLVRL